MAMVAAGAGAGADLGTSDAPQLTTMTTPEIRTGAGSGFGSGTETQTQTETTASMDSESRFDSAPGSAHAPGSAPGSAPEPALPVTKPKRRFVPQLIERTVKSSSNRTGQPVSSSASNENGNTKPEADANNNLTSSTNGPSPLNPSGDISNANQTAGDRNISVQSKDPDVSATAQPSTKPIRRFAPIPIETTFDSYRVTNKNPRGPATEPTPDPSPTASQSSIGFSSTASPMTPENKMDRKKPKRRFAPQLIETTRSSRRAGQEGPAMKPTDKTDITPGTNHIYVLKPKSKHTGKPRVNNNSAGLSAASAENATTSPRYRRHTRSSSSRSIRTNSYHPELDTILSSESGNSSEDEDKVADSAASVKPAALCNVQSNPANSWSTRGYDLRNRRESCDEEFSGYLLGIAAREAHRQREFEQALSAFPNGLPPQGVEHFLARDNSEDDLQIGDDESPLRHGPSQLLRRKSTDPGWAVKEMRAHAEKMARMRGDALTSVDRDMASSDVTPPPEDSRWSATVASGEPRNPVTKGSTGSSFLSAQLPVLPGRLPPGHDKLFTPPPSTGARSSPFGTGFAFRPPEPEPEDGALVKMQKAASPPMLGGDLSFPSCPSPKYTRMEPNHPYSHFDQIEERQRDKTGATGLWRGYCSSKTGNLDAPSLQPPDLLRTPSVCPTSDPFAAAFEASTSNGDSGTAHGASDESDKENGAREQAFLAEFDDSFVTQVYNYLSLGYPATARSFDDELSKFSGMPLEELRRYDNVKVGKGFMRHMEMSVNGSGSFDSTSDGSSSEDDQLAPPPIFEYEKKPRWNNPRWKALKLYIHEWARQHPSLNDDDDLGPPAWGVRARRGSWAI